MKKYFSIALAVIILAAATGLGACSTNQSGLSGINWVLESYGPESNLKAVITTTKVTAKFDLETGQVSGSGGVNQYGGKLKVSGDKMTLTEINQTLMASMDERVNEQETAYFELLRTAGKFKIANGQLTIDCGSGKLVFRAE